MPDTSRETPKPLDLSSLQLMPDWVADLDTGNTRSYEAFQGEETGARGTKGGRGRDGGRRGDDYGAPRRDDRRGGDRRDDRRSGDRRDDLRSGDRRDDRRGGPQGRDDRERAPRFPDGIVAEIRPTAVTLEALVKRIKMSGRAFAMFDLAKLVIDAGDRYEVVFKSGDSAANPHSRDPRNARDSRGNWGGRDNRGPRHGAGPGGGGPENLLPSGALAPGEAGAAVEKPKLRKLFVCKPDRSVWLDRDEAVRHFLEGPGLEKFYDVELREIDPPKGEFTSVAVCGMSGTVIGPPNHHSYQTAVLRLHRERFANMPLDRFKSRIRIETDEEKVAQWKESQSRVTHYLYPKRKVEVVPAPEAREEPPAGPVEPAGEETAPTVEEGAPVSQEPAVQEPAAEQPAAEQPAAEEPAAEEPVARESSEPPQERLESREALERHVFSHLAGRIVAELDRAVVPGTVAAQTISPPLLALLRANVENARRSPFPVVRSLCSGLEKRGLKIFKRQGKKLFVSKARPRAVDPNVVLSDNVKKIIDVVDAQPGIKVSEMVTSLAPRPKDQEYKEGEFTQEETSILSNLHWLIDEGLIIEYTSSALFLGARPRKEPEPSPVAAVTTTEETAPVVESAAEPAATEPAAAAEGAIAPAEVPSTPVQETPLPSEPTPEAKEPSREPEPEVATPVVTTAPESEPEAEIESSVESEAAAETEAEAKVEPEAEAKAAPPSPATAEEQPDVETDRPQSAG